MGILFLILALLLPQNIVAASTAIPGIGGGSGGGFAGTNSFVVRTPIGTTCNADPCTIEQQFSSDGLNDAVTSISRSSTGVYTINVKSGFCETGIYPICVMTSGRPGNQRMDSSGNPATEIWINQYTSGGSAEDTQGLNVSCVCDKP